MALITRKSMNPRKVFVTSTCILIFVSCLTACSNHRTDPVAAKSTLPAARPSGAVSTHSVIRSRIVSDFDGLDFGNVYKLANGQWWQQTGAYIWIHIAVMPRVEIRAFEGVHMMRVEGIDDAVIVERLEMIPQVRPEEPGGTLTAHQVATLSKAGGPGIFAADGKFLGTIESRFAIDSVGNEFGPHGSKFSIDSIRNAFGLYGGKFSIHSPYNPHTPTPPVLLINRSAVAYVTVNKGLRPRVHPDTLLIVTRGDAAEASPVEGTVVLLDKAQEPVAFIDFDDGATVFLWSGKPVAYLDEESVFSFEGKHLGWYSGAKMYDNEGSIVAVTADSSAQEGRSPSPTQFKPFKGFKEFKPFKPSLKDSWSEVQAPSFFLLEE